MKIFTNIQIEIKASIRITSLDEITSSLYSFGQSVSFETHREITNNDWMLLVIDVTDYQFHRLIDFMDWCKQVIEKNDGRLLNETDLHKVILNHIESCNSMIDNAKRSIEIIEEGRKHNKYQVRNEFKK